MPAGDKYIANNPNKTRLYYMGKIVFHFKVLCKHGLNNKLKVFFSFCTANYSTFVNHKINPAYLKSDISLI